MASYSSTTIGGRKQFRDGDAAASIDPSPAASYVARVMANLEILTIPDPVLRRKSAPVERIDAATRRFMDEMLKTMYDAPGIGLAAIQVGEPRRIITIDVAREEEAKSPLFLVN